MRLVESKKDDYKKILNLASKLKVKSKNIGWFTKEAVNFSIPLDVKFNKNVLAYEGGKLVGFLNYFSEEGILNIGWLGVDPTYHGKGVGSQLVEKLVKLAKKNKIKYIHVDTVPKNQANAPYRKTISFYEKVGFKVHKIEKGAYENCDKAIMRKRV